MTDRANAAISVIIPTYNSAVYLARLLESLARADKSFGPVEVLVIDDSRPEEAQIIRDLCVQYEAIYLACAGNVSKKRNFGSTHATHDLLLFVDSDCEVTPTLLAEHATLASAPDHIGAVLGIVEFVGQDTFMWRAVQRTQFLGAYSFAKMMEYAPWGGAGNLTVLKQAFDTIGGFDTEFLRSPGGEDVDLGIRLNKAGYRIQCNSKAVMYHTRETWQSFRRMVRRVYGYGRADYRVLVKHEDMVGVDYPRLSVMMLVTTLLLIISALVHSSLFPLLLIPLFCLLTLLTQAILVLRHDQSSLYAIGESLGAELIAHTLELVFELGTVVESIKHRDLRGIYCKVIFSPYQLLFERHRKIIQMWSVAISYLLVALTCTGVR